jgi:hypothetical protein
MGDSKSITLTVAELDEFADRLSDRANAIENLATQDLANDLRLASRLIFRLAKITTEIARAAESTPDPAMQRHLRELAGN